MELIISLVVTFLLVLLLRKPIKNYPVVFYVLLVAVDILFLSGVLFGVSREIATIGYPYVVRCLVGISLFVIVMYIGALGDGNRIRRMLMPIRGELSVMACILTFGHVISACVPPRHHGGLLQHVCRHGGISCGVGSAHRAAGAAVDHVA